MVLDIGIICLYLVASLLIGVIAKRYIENIVDFLVVGRGLNTSIAVATLVASETGLVTLVYYAELGYVCGFAALAIGVIKGLSMWITGKTGLIVRRLREMEIMTIPEFYEKRFNTKVRVLGGVIAAISGILNQGIFIVIGARFLNVIFDISEVYLSLTMIVLLSIVLFYTLLGGMVSVIVTDFIQYIMMVIGMGVVTWLFYTETGFNQIVSRVQNTMGYDGWDPFMNPRLGIVFFIWQTLMWFSANTIWQTNAMRVFSVKDVGVVKRALEWSGIAFIGRATIPIFWGMAALAYFGNRGGNLEALDAMPAMLAEIVPAGLLGLVLSAMLAAFMSTNSCYLLSWSAILTQDVIAPLRKKDMTSKERIFLTRIFVVLIGLLLLVWGLWYKIPETAYQYLTLTGTIYLSGAFIAILLGVYWKKTNVYGAYAAIILAAIIPLMSVFLSQMKETLPEWLLPVTKSSYAGILAYMVALAGGVIGTLLTQRNGKQTV